MFPLQMEQPYADMLSSLSSVAGFDEFVHWLEPRRHVDLDWRAEIKALFEINKPKHPLIRICSHEESEPEAFFRMPASETLALLECAFVRYKFDSNQEKRTCENICKMLFAPAQTQLQSAEDSVVVLVRSFRTPPTAQDAEAVLRALKEGVPPNRLLEVGFGFFGYFERGGGGEAISEQFDEDALSVTVYKRGFVIGGANTDISAKIEALVKNKRRQHRAKYGEFFKVFYFLVDCPPPKLARLDLDHLARQVKSNEMLVGCAVGVIAGSFVEAKRIVPPAAPEALDLTNRFFGAATAS